MKKARFLFLTLVVILIASLALVSCTPAAEEPAEEAMPEEEAPAEEEAPVEEGPTVGGTWIYANTQEPDTLDIYKSSFSISSLVTWNLGGALVAKDADGQIVPFLAKSWDISDDGLVYTFNLRDDVKFHNGDPFTANDFKWTWDRCRTEGFVCPVSASMLAPIVSIEAPDDYTLVLTLAEPNYYILSALGAADYLQPLNQNVVEADGDNYGLSGYSAVGVGPYMLKEWVQDEKIVLARNPDFVWGPELFEGGNTGPYYIEELEFRVVPDEATVLAAVEASELGYAVVEAKDLETVKAIGNYTIHDIMPTGISYLQFNHQNPMFADLKVRQAMNLAVDKEAILQVALNGEGVVIDGPLSPAMIGYDESAMLGTGYGYDLEAAKALMAEAGYTTGDDGMLINPDGEAFAFTLLATPDESVTKISTMVVDMYKQLGIAVEIQQMEWGTMAPLVFGGEYEMCAMGVGWPDADVLYMMFHTANIGGINFAYYSNPELDALLEQARTLVDPVEHQQAVNSAYALIVDEALMVPLYTPTTFIAIHNDFQGVVISPFIGVINSDLYYVGE